MFRTSFKYDNDNLRVCLCVCLYMCAAHNGKCDSGRTINQIYIDSDIDIELLTRHSWLLPSQWIGTWTWPRYLHLSVSDRDRNTRKQRVIWSRKCLMACFVSESEQRQVELQRRQRKRRRVCNALAAKSKHYFRKSQSVQGGKRERGVFLTDNDMRGFMSCSVSGPELDSVTGNGVVKS